MYCTQCGNLLQPDAKYCAFCGEAISSNGQHASSVIMQEGHKKADKQASFIGQNQSFYFEKWKKENSWNWVSFFWLFFWLGYRKMYSYIFIIIGAYLVIDIVIFMMNPYLMNRLSAPIGIGMSAVMGIYGNQLYKKHMEKKIKEIENMGYSPEDEKRAIEAAGGTSGLGMLWSTLILIGYFIVFSMIYWEYL